METLHRILTGAGNLTSRQLQIAGIVVIGWIAIDVIQFTDWAVQKFYPTPVVVVSGAPLQFDVNGNLKVTCK